MHKKETVLVVSLRKFTSLRSETMSIREYPAVTHAC